MGRKFPPIIWIARNTYARMLKAHGKVKLDNACGVNLDDGPFLYLLNHVGIMDPVMVSAVAPHHIRWVAGAYLFKSKFLNLVIGKWCTAIPKQQGKSDVSMVRNVQKALKAGDNVGLFPEGTRTWDGEMVPFDYKPLAKLIRLYKVKVIFAHIEGGFAYQPRWADEKRKGKVTISLKHLLTPEQIGAMDIDTLKNTVEEYLHFSNDEWKESVDYSYVSPRRAEGLQRLMYMCPKCRGIDTMRTSGNRITCSKCGTMAVLTEKDDLTSVDIPFTKLSQWHNWEAEEIGKLDGLPEEPGVLLQKGDFNNEGDLDVLSEHISVRIESGVMIVKCNDGDKKEYRLPISEVSSLILNAKQTIELFCGEDLYRIRLKPKACSLKYQEYYLAYSKRKADKEAEV